ncbi:MAG: hypothetical protein NVS9B15_18340 [Acidobacteriaceae bacterium]
MEPIMQNLRLRLWVLTALVMLVFSLRANATPLLGIHFTANATTVTVPSTSTGLITFGPVPVGGFTLIGLTGTAGPLLNAPDLMDLTATIINGPSAGTLTIAMSLYNLTAPVGPLFTTAVGGTFSGLNTTATFSTYYNAANVPFALGTLISTCSVTNSSSGINPFTCSGMNSVPVVGFGPGGYAITQIITISIGGNKTISFDSGMQAVPEPSGLALLGTGMLCLAGVIRRRFRA